MSESEHSALIRNAAFQHIRKWQDLGCLTSAELGKGFIYNGERIPLTNPRRGIFKPRQMEHLLSIKTVFPSARKTGYDDQHTALQMLLSDEELISYSFMGTNPNAADNRHMYEAYHNHIPIIYFLGFFSRRYLLIAPAYIVDWNPNRLEVRVACGLPGETSETLIKAPTPDTRRYASRTIKQRLHQALFREKVISAYNGKCAISGMPMPQLLDAAHIKPDKDQGLPIVSNGIPLTKIHHAAFDANLIGIDPDYRLHLSEKLIGTNDGEMLEVLKQIDGRAICLPAREQDHPDRDLLAWRYEKFQSSI